MKSKQSTFTIFGLFLVALLTTSPLFAAVQVSATVSNNTVAVNDMFILTVTINDNDDDYQLDTRSLEDNFSVSRPSRSQSTSIINFDRVQQTEWKVRLQAKQAGTFMIPSLKIGDYHTDPIEIRVREASQVQQDTVQDEMVFIENSLNESDIYVGQAVIFTTKLYIAKNSNELDLIAPSFEGAQASVYGEDNNSQTIRNGIRYNTITRQYKLTPTQAGQFEINSPLLTGTLRNVVAVSQWQNRVVAEPINVRGQRLNINVKAIPKDYQGEWLVSEDLRLIEDNDLTAQQYKVGDPITRSITLQIASVGKDKLPTLKLNYPSSLRMYPDQDQLQEGQANGLTYGIRIMSHAIIADTAGTLTLPEVKLNWFNSRTNKAEVALLPEQVLTILPAEQQQLTTLPTETTVTPVKQTIIVDHQALLYWQLAVAVLLVLLLLMVFYHLAYRRSQTHNKPVKTAPKKSDELDPMLKKSLTDHDAPKCYSLLLKCAQQQYPTLKSLSELPAKSALDAEKSELLKHEIQWLQICCSDKSQQWNANKLAELLKLSEAQKAQKNQPDPMNLNP